MTDNQKERELLPCPFCGGGATISHWDNSGKYTKVNCIRCGANTGKRLRSFDAVAAWNTRPQSTLLPVLEQAREALAKAQIAAENFPDIHDGRTPAGHIIGHLHEWEAEHLKFGEVAGLDKALAAINEVLKG